MKRGLKAAACAFFVWHMLAIAVQQIPQASALAPLKRPFVHYQEATGIWQGWDMFTTIPYYHSYGLDVIATEPDGHMERVGVGLPGFTSFGGVVRTETAFSRILYEPDFDGYLGAYDVKMCSALHERLGHGGQKIFVRESAGRLRFLEQIRADGVISKPEEHDSPSFTCPR
ncbi:MAG: hypothetical protein ACRENE_33885 [Polyangiaceae bacterium]